LVDLQRMAYPHKWSPISCKSSAGQRKDTGQRPMLYRWTTRGDGSDSPQAQCWHTLNDADLQFVYSVKMSLHLSAPGLYAGQSTVQCKVDVTANLHRHTTSDIHTMITSCDLPTMGIVTTGQSNLTQRPHCRHTWMVQSCSQVAPMCTPSNTCFLGPPP